MAKELIIDTNVFLEDGVTPNPNFGTAVEIDHPDPLSVPPLPPVNPTKADLLSKIEELLTAVQALPD